MERVWEGHRKPLSKFYQSGELGCITAGALSKMDTGGGLEKLRGQMIHTLLRRWKFEDAQLLGEYWMVIFDAAGMFRFKERLCPHCLKKDLHKGTEMMI